MRTLTPSIKHITMLAAVAVIFGSSGIIVQAQENIANVPIDFSANGMTASEACAFFREKLSTEDNALNVVVAPEAENVVLPDMNLRHITFAGFADFINGIGNEMEVPRAQRFGINQGDDVWYFWAEPNKDSGSERTETIVRSLPKDVEGTLGLIEAVIDAKSGSSLPVLKLHEPTHTLIATGTRDSLSLVSDIIANAKESEDGGALAMLKEDLESSNQQWESKLRIAEREREIETKSLSVQLEQLQEQLAMSNAERQKLQQIIATLEAKLAAASAGR
ncbi:MAG: hypothetical protein KDN22_32310 [Verrucomicrobiae bacterium]|nr:hypothetical protein [Verrucomicrobiae bacterium]